MNEKLKKAIEKFRMRLDLSEYVALWEGTTLSHCGFSSLDILDLVTTLESKFDIYINANGIDGDTTLGELQAIIEKQTCEDESFVDLGLPSGTKWAKRDAEIGDVRLFSADEAIDEFYGSMPDAVQLAELVINCRQEWERRDGKYGVKLIGPNDKSIFIPEVSHTIGGTSRVAVLSKSCNPMRSSEVFATIMSQNVLLPICSTSRDSVFSVRLVSE